MIISVRGVVCESNVCESRDLKFGAEKPIDRKMQLHWNMQKNVKDTISDHQDESQQQTR